MRVIGGLACGYWFIYGIIGRYKEDVTVMLPGFLFYFLISVGVFISVV